MAVRKIPIEEITKGDRARKELGDIEQLAKSIDAVGLLHPIVVNKEHKLIAGERRLAAVTQLKWDAVPCNVVSSLEEASKELQAERDENTCRKDFLPSEAVALGERLSGLVLERVQNAHSNASKEGGKVAGKGRPRDRGGQSLPTPKKRDESKRKNAQIGESVGMSRDTYRKAEKVINSGNDDLIKEMDETGKVDRAYKKLKKAEKLKEEEQAAKTAASRIAGEDENFVFHGDSFQLAREIPDESCSLIFTDPPYDRASLHWFAHLGLLASKILVPGGSLITYCGQYVIPEVIEAVSPQWSADEQDRGLPGCHDWLDDDGEKVFNTMRWFWVNCCLHTGGTAQMREYGIKVKWKPMLWFVKGDFRRDRETWVEDLVTSRQEKESHPWQQSVIEARHYIDTLTNPGELVVDPFCGGGTTAVAAKQLGRRWWTADVNPVHVETARGRLS